MMVHSKKTVILLFEACDKPIPQFVADAPEDAKFAMGWSLGGHVPLHLVGTKRPRALSGVLSVDPSTGLENMT
jgi:hypothetical protein